MKFVQDKMTKLWTYIDYTSGSDSSVIADRQILLFFFFLLFFFSVCFTVTTYKAAFLIE